MRLLCLILFHFHAPIPLLIICHSFAGKAHREKEMTKKNLAIQKGRSCNTLILYNKAGLSIITVKVWNYYTSKKAKLKLDEYRWWYLDCVYWKISSFRTNSSLSVDSSSRASIRSVSGTSIRNVLANSGELVSTFRKENATFYYLLTSQR